MLAIVVKGIGLGVALAFLIGPVFFLLIQTSIKKGFLPAFYLALGVSICDALYVFITYFGMAQYSSDESVIRIMGIGGGALLMVFGLFSIFKKAEVAKEEVQAITKSDRIAYFFKGFSINAINPAVLFFWIGTVGVASLQFEYENHKVALFFGCTVVTVFLTDLLKIYLADKLSTWLQPNVLTWLNRISGVALLAFGLKLIIEKGFQIEIF